MSTPPEDSVCPSCEVPLTEANVFNVDVTDPLGTPPWERAKEDDARVYVLYCIDCALAGRVELEP